MRRQRRPRRAGRHRRPAPVLSGTVCVGLDVGGTKVLGVVADAAGAVLAEARVRTPLDDGPAMVAAMAEVVGTLCAVQPEAVAVGAGVAGVVTHDGVVRYSPNLPAVRELPVARLLGEVVGLPVALDNDATCALRAEHRAGAAHGLDDVALVALGTGIGGAFVLGGRLYRGAHGFAGEIGHQVVVADGIPCVCGRRGCWERYASGTALARYGGRPGEEVVAAARAGHAAALAAVDELARWTALGLVNLVQAVDVSTIVLGGGLAEAADVLLEPVRAAFAEQAVAPEHRPPVTVVAASMGELAGAIGAALLAQSVA